MHLHFLNDVLANPNAMVESLRPMLDAWARGDEGALAAVTMEQGGNDDPRFYDIVFTNRNATWAQWVKTRLETPGTVFMAVGAGHLVGRGSVQEQLRGMNIASQRVPHQPDGAAPAAAAAGTATRDYPLCRSRSQDRCRQAR